MGNGADHTPVNAPGIHQPVKLFLGAAGPFGTDHGQGLGTVVGVVAGQTFQPQPFYHQALRQLGLPGGGQTQVDQTFGPLQVTHGLPAGNIGGQGIGQMNKGLVFHHGADLPSLALA